MSQATEKSDKKASQKTAEPSIGEKINDFIQKNRRAIILGFFAIVVIVAAFIITSAVTERVQLNALSRVDEFEIRYAELISRSVHEGSDGVLIIMETRALLNELAVFARRNSRFAAARAHIISAEIHEWQQNWAEAETAWTSAAVAAGRSYLAPLSFFNAAVAAEEQGNIESAITLYNRALEFGDTFPAAARAQFSIGRLRESQNNRQAALEAYRSLVGRWPNDPLWANLAQSRIVILSN
jgi:tetratricopeptide (TPR) repeat protein